MRTVIGGAVFFNWQSGAIDGAQLPGYLVKWGKSLFSFFSTRNSMEEWFMKMKKTTSENHKPFPPLEVVYNSQRYGFFADIEGYVPLDMDDHDLTQLKWDIMDQVNKAYSAAGLTSIIEMVSESPDGFRETENEDLIPCRRNGCRFHWHWKRFRSGEAGEENEQISKSFHCCEIPQHSILQVW